MKEKKKTKKKEDFVKGLGKFYTEMAIRAAMNTALRFQCQVWLVGSAIDNKDPLDIDIILVSSSYQQYRLFGDITDYEDGYSNYMATRYWKRLLRFCNKQKFYFESFLHNWDVDIKIQDIESFKAHKGKKMRLDPFGDAFDSILELRHCGHEKSK